MPAPAVAVLAAAASLAGTDPVTIATFNVEFLLPDKVHLKYGLPFELEEADERTWSAPGYRRERFERSCEDVADYIAGRLDADVLVLQEIGDRDAVATLVGALRRRGRDYPHWDVCDSFDEATGQHVAVLSRRPFETVRHDGLATVPGWETYDTELDDADTELDGRVTKGMHVRFEAGGRPVNLIGLHLKSERGGHESDAWRIAQASIVRRYYLPYLQRGEHVIVAGDLNDRRGHPAIRRIRGRDDLHEDLLQTGQSRFFPWERRDQLDERYTYVFRGVRGQIDHVLISRSVFDACGLEGITPTFLAVEDDRVSDHRPLAVRFEFPVAEPTARGRGAHPMLGAAAWQQTALEFRIVCEEIFRRAGERLAELVTDPAALADPQHPPAAAGARGPERVAVIMDVDQTLLDGTPYIARLAWSNARHTPAEWKAWCRQRRAEAVPGSIEFARAVLDLGRARRDVRIELFLVTNRDAEVEADTIENLRALGLDVDAEHVLSLGERDGWTRGKTRRRAHVASLGFRIAMLVGDDLNDLAPARGLDRPQREALYARHADFVARGLWVLVPNAIWGSWVTATTAQGDAEATPAERLVHAMDRRLPPD